MKENEYKILNLHTLKDPEQLKQILRELQDFFGEPVLPVTKYCKALYTYLDLRAEKDEKFAEMYGFLNVSVNKSCLLDRLIYCGEELRTEKCPTHDGIWSGCDFDQKITCCRGPCGCITGWLPNK